MVQRRLIATPLLVGPRAPRVGEVWTKTRSDEDFLITDVMKGGCGMLNLSCVSHGTTVFSYNAINGSFVLRAEKVTLVY